MDLLVITSRWDEVEGPVVVNYLPKPNVLLKPIHVTELATQAFMSSQSIFGYDQYERTLVVMPFLQYSCKGLISFDYVEDEEVRGGRNPFFVGIFVPSAFDDSLFSAFEIELQKFMLEERGKRETQINLERLVRNLSRIFQASEAKIQAFSTFQENWALLTDEKGDLLWKFGRLDKTTSGLISSLSVQLAKIAAEEGGAMSVCFVDQRRRPEKEVELFILAFHGRFFLIASNPDITSRLLRIARVKGEELDLVRGVLSGQAMGAYANLWGDASEPMQALIDRIFDDALMELGIDQSSKDTEVRVHAKDGMANLAALDLSELLFLHWYLRRRFTSEVAIATEPWAIFFDATGIVKATYQKEDGLVLAGYLSSIFSFFSYLFNSYPKSIVFGVKHFNSIEILEGEGERYFLATNNSLRLFQDKKYYKFLKEELPEEILRDLEGKMKQEIAEKIASEMKTSMLDRSINALGKEFIKHSAIKN
ncbi:MAG: hypothetical protein ACFFGZ_07460 [Candidatus Thorarchaeota archaeon]